MSFKDNWNKSVNKTKDRIKDKTNNTIDRVQNKYNRSAMGRFNNASNNHARLNVIKGEIEKTKAYKKTIAVIQKIASFILTNGVAILIVLAVIILLWNGLIFGLSIAQSVSSTPHYYCDIDPDQGTRRTAVYKQYCNNDGAGFNLDNINGHYIVQDGSGPCTDCACANLLLRYFSSKEINFYDYLWDANGQYDSSKTIQTNLGSTNVRSYIAAAGETSCTVTRPLFANGSYNFTSSHTNPNNCDPNSANWGYVRDESVDYEGQSNPYESLADNTNWVWDLSPETTWTAQWTNGNFITIDGVTATWEHITGTWGTGDNLRALLDEHPSGIVVYRDYGPGKHAILVTGYDHNGFKVVDSARGVSGGFEGPATSANFCVQSIWNNELLEHPVGVVSYTYIAEDTP